MSLADLIEVGGMRWGRRCCVKTGFAAQRWGFTLSNKKNCGGGVVDIRISGIVVECTV